MWGNGIDWGVGFIEMFCGIKPNNQQKINMTLKEVDKEYIDAISSTDDTLKPVARSIETNYDFDLDKTEISEAILNRLSAYYKTQNEIKNFLNKRYQTVGADFYIADS